MLKSLSRFFLFLCAFVAAWGTSGTLGWSLLLMLSVASFAFIFSVCDTSAFPLISRPSARENPFFISGLVLIAINLIQVLNPYAKVVEFYGYQTVQFLEYVKFLPSGIVRDWGLRDSFFVLLQLAATWYVAMSSWKLLREDSMFARRFIKFLAINGTLIAILGVAQELTNAKGIYWLIPTNSHFYSTFGLKTAAGDFIFMAFMCCVSWAVSSFNRRRFFNVSLAVICAGICFYSCFLATSSGVNGILLLTALAIFVFAIFRLFCRLKKKYVALGFALLLAGFISAWAFAFRGEGSSIIARLKPNIDSAVASLAPRLAIAHTSFAIFKDSPILGAGAGAYGVKAEILSPQSEYRGRYKVFINAAHNDLFEYVCEYGIFALASLILCFAIWIRSFKRIEWSVHNSIFLWACLMYMLHSMFDLLLHIPSTMFAFVFMMSLASTNFRGGRRGTSR